MKRASFAAIASAALLAAFAATGARAVTTSPESVQGLAIWLDANDVYATGVNAADQTAISSWVSKVGNASFVQYNSAFLPVVVHDAVNGLPAVRFTRPAVDQAQYLEFNSVAVQSLLDNPNTIFVVVRANGGTGEDLNGNYSPAEYVFCRPGWHSGLTFEGYPYANVIVANRWLAGLGSNNLELRHSYTHGEPVLVTRKVDGGLSSASSSISLAVGGEAPVSTYASSPLWNHDSNGNQTVFRLGCGFATCGLDGDIAEFLLYDHVLTDAETLEVQRYLQSRWGLGLVVADPVTGDTFHTTSPSVFVADIPLAGTCAEYQFTFSSDPSSVDPSAWVARADAPTATVVFPAGTPSGDVTVHLWLREDSSATDVIHLQATIAYVSHPPVAVAKNVTLVVDPSIGRDILPADVDGGSVSPDCEIVSMTVSPSHIAAAGQLPVTLTVTDAIGQTATATATVTAVPGAYSGIRGIEGLPVTAGLYFHLAADDLAATLADGAPVASWPSSVSNLVAVQDTATRRPTFVANAQNGHAVVRFDGTAVANIDRDSMVVDNLPYSPDMTIFVVVRGTTYQSLLRWQRNCCMVYPWGESEAESRLFDAYNGGNNVSPTSGCVTGFRHNEWNIGCASIDTGVSEGVHTYRNGVMAGASTWNNPIPNGGTMDIGCYFGGGGDPFEFFDGDLAEILFYNRALSDAEHELVGAHLQAKYGIRGAYPAFTAANPVTGSYTVAGGNTLNMVALAIDAPGAEYQFTASADPASLDPSGWAPFDRYAPPATATFNPPAAAGPFVFTMWLRAWDYGTLVTNTYTQEMIYAPDPLALSTNEFAVNAYGSAGTSIPRGMIADAIVPGYAGLGSLSFAPATVTQSGTVMVTLVSEAGVSTNIPVYVNVVQATDAFVSGEGDDESGDGSLARPFRTITRALACANAAGVGGAVRVMEGYYGVSTGEAYPLEFDPGVSLTAYPEGADRNLRVLDGENDYEASTLVAWEQVGDATASLSGFWIRGTWSCPVYVNGGDLEISDCLFTHTSWSSYPAICAVINNGRLVVRDSEVVGTTNRSSVVSVWNYGSHTDDIRVTLSNCVVRANHFQDSGIMLFEGAAVKLRVQDCVFEGNTVPMDQFIGDNGKSPFIVCGGKGDVPSVVQVDRCRVVGNAGVQLLGVKFNDGASEPSWVRDSLFADNDLSNGNLRGWAASLDVVNCTFLRNGGNFAMNGLATTMRNCIVASEGDLTWNVGVDSGATSLVLRDTIVWDTGVGDGYAADASANVIAADPRFASAAVSWDDPLFDARLTEGSPAIDAGDNAFASACDLDLTPRVKNGHTGKGARVDIGCYERYVREKGTILLLE